MLCVYIENHSELFENIFRFSPNYELINLSLILIIS